MKTRESKKRTKKDKTPSKGSGFDLDESDNNNCVDEKPRVELKSLPLKQFMHNRFYKFFVMLDGICEMFDDWRIVPRAIIVLYSFVFWRVVEWFMLLPDPTTEQVAFVSAIVGVAAAFFGIYTNGGGKNNNDRE